MGDRATRGCAIRVGKEGGGCLWRLNADPLAVLFKKGGSQDTSTYSSPAFGGAIKKNGKNACDQNTRGGKKK